MTKATLAQQNAELIETNADLLEELALLTKNESLIQENARLAEQIAVAKAAKAAMDPCGGVPLAPLMPIRAPPGLPPPLVPHVPTPGVPVGMSLAAFSDGFDVGGRIFHQSRTTTCCRLSRKSSVSSLSSASSVSRTASTYSARSDASTASSSILDEATKLKYNAWPTAVMIKNVPKNFVREQLLEIVDAAGFQNDYNVVSMPIDIKSEIGLGYAFLNFTTHEHAERFIEHFRDFKDWHAPSDEPCEVTWTDTLKGYEAIIERYRNSPVMHESVADKFKPAVYKDGIRIPFPEPTKFIKAPRLRRRDHSGAGKVGLEGSKTSEAN